VAIRFEHKVDLVGANLTDYIDIEKKNFSIDFSLDKNKNNYKLLSDM